MAEALTSNECKPDHCLHGVHYRVECPSCRELFNVHGGLIQLAAEFTRGSCIPDWSDSACFCKGTPERDRAKVRQAFRLVDDKLKDYAVALRNLADRLSKEWRR